ncbi:gustatory receptor for sugar taste 43a [Ceratina calcarata]|uniref:Gustatory receptor n=1 Tax=Ceratina calcarata TaxID=156304 RepID=A0AAJ7WER8_9HYME|nr:gustatory receptor for sugar taste 43a [Ceratina calcarata]
MGELSEKGRKKVSLGGDLCRSISPIYYLGKLCGLIPVRFLMRSPMEYRVRLHAVDVSYSIFVLMLLLGAEIWGMWRDLKDGWEHSTRLKSRTAVIATCSDVLGVMILTVVCVGGSCFRWNHLQTVMNKLIEVDKKIGVPSMKKIRRFTIGLTICTLAYLWLNSILDFYSWDRKTTISKAMPDKGPINYAPLYFMYTVIISTEIQYTVCTYNIGKRFARLNSNLNDLLNGKRNDNANENNNQISYLRKSEKKKWNLSGKQLILDENRKLYTSSVSELMIVHSSLCDTVSLVNTAFGVVILTVTVTCLLHLVITPYFLIVQAVESNEWIFLLVQGGWCIFHVTRMLIIVQPSYFTVVEGKRTAVLVSRLLSCSFEANTRQELEIFSLQLLHRPLEFSPCGLFDLDRTLITSMAGVVTTYLVILVQFQNADDTKGEVDIIRNATQILRNASPLQNLTGIKINV